jgi:hypothetical protein
MVCPDHGGGFRDSGKVVSDIEGRLPSKFAGTTVSSERPKIVTAFITVYGTSREERLGTWHARSVRRERDLDPPRRRPGVCPRGRAALIVVSDSATEGPGWLRVRHYERIVSVANLIGCDQCLVAGLEVASVHKPAASPLRVAGYASS